jgi:hypothetical protein
VAENGRLFWTEALYSRLAESFYRFHDVTIGVYYLGDSAMVVAVWKEGHATRLPFLAD